MFKLHRKSSSSSTMKSSSDSGGLKFDFTFDNFQATQVPKKWDRLLISLISVESGKTIGKSGKASVRNGMCEWKDTSLSESVWIILDDDQHQHLLFKFVVSMGSASSILGEVIINLTDYTNTRHRHRHRHRHRAAAAFTFPLNNCNHGGGTTTLHLNIHCTPTPPTTILRKNNSTDFNSHLDQNVNSIVSSSTKEMASRETSFSRYTTHSPNSDFNGDVYNSTTRQDSLSSPHGSHSVDTPTQSNHSSFNARTILSDTPPSLKNEHSSNNLLEAAEDTVDELRAVAKMWETNARKLMLDLDLLKKDFSHQSQKYSNVDIECDGLKKEVERLTLSLEELAEKQTAKEGLAFQGQGKSQYANGLEDELKFQKDSNHNLSLQLNRSQESNIQLLSVLQELEETIEKLKSENQSLSAIESKFIDMENSIRENSEENRILALQLQSLKQDLQEKDHEIENERCLNSQKLLDIEMEYKQKLFAESQELAMLEAKLSEALEDRNIEENGPDVGGDANLIREIEMLKEKVMDLENDCNELTDENFELLLKLKDLQNMSPKSNLDEEMKKNNEEEFDIFELVKQIEIAFSLVRKPCYNISSRFNEEFEFNFDGVVKSNRIDVLCKNGQAESILKYMVELNKVLDTKITECDEALKHGEAKIKELESKNLDLVNKNADQVKVSISQRDEIVQLMAGLLSKDEEIRALRQFKTELETQVSDLQANKIQTKENMETAQEESNIASKCVNDLRNDIAMLSSTVDSHVDTNKCLEEKLSELESERHDLGLHLSELEQENILLSERISRFEAQIRIELETGKVDLKEKSEDTKRQLSEAQEERENLKKVNLNLEATANFAIEESIFRKKSNGEFEKQNYELHEQCTKLEAEFRGLSARLVDFSDRLNSSEENIISLLKDFSTKEESINSEINVLLVENRKHNEKLIMVESLLNKPKSANQELKTIANDLELKLTVSEYERQQLMEEAGRLKLLNILKADTKVTPVYEDMERSEGDNGFDTKDGSHHGVEVDLLSKIQLLENELADALDANNLYKAQLNRLLPGGRNSHPDNPTNEKIERTQSLQAELRDLQERYFNMSLKYAEVEAEREELVMKLKNSKNVKRWFS